jgi:DNA helicase IV
MQHTLVQRLRDRAYSFKAPDPLVEEAANEIERLRLTDEEREAIEFKAAHCVTVADQMHQRCAVTLRRLLERTTL